MLIGSFERNIDNKGRLMIPSKFRREFKDAVILYPGIDKNCLMVASEEEFTEMMKTVNTQTLLNSDYRKLVANTYYKAQTSEIDPQGRLQINSAILSQFGIKDKVIVSGMGTQFSIMSPEAYDKATNLSGEELSALADRLSEKK